MKRRTMPTAVRSEIGCLEPDMRRSSLAIAALVLADRLEDASPREAPAVVRELRDTLRELRSLAGTQEGGDPIDDLAERRRDRTA